MYYSEVFRVPLLYINIAVLHANGTAESEANILSLKNDRYVKNCAQSEKHR